VTISLDQAVLILQRIANRHNIDNEHGDRVSHLALAVGKELNGGTRLDAGKLRLLDFAARVHDLGQVDIDDYIKSKNGKLTRSQTAAMREHPIIGYEFVKDILPPEITFTILYHHEHWDGTGYPHGLRGLDIPLFARIICIVDSYDGIMSKRSYHEARTQNVALLEMNKYMHWFDPMLYTIFLKVLREQQAATE
jgi:HD-GYP domain-containing protein (c-di-GMP phosphodiesterase class II)